MEKSTIYRAAFALVIMNGALPAVSQQQDPGQNLEQNLTAQEQTEYRQRLNNASGDQERNAIQSEYEKMVQNRYRLQDGSASEQRGSGAGQGKGGHHAKKGRRRGDLRAAGRPGREQEHAPEIREIGNLVTPDTNIIGKIS